MSELASKERIKEISEYAYKHGSEKASEVFGVSMSTVGRYKREYQRKTLPKILVFDLENAPVSAYVWNTKVWNTYVGHDQIERDWYMISWSAKWLFDNEVMGDVLSSNEAIKGDDSRIIKSLWHLFDEADIIIAHNAHKFDVPMANTRFIMNGMKPASPYQIIDTLQVARKNFRFTHNKLEYIARLFGIGSKHKTDFQLWVDCMKGDQGALAIMSAYNDQDVLLLEEVYLKLRPWIKSHPNLNNFSEDGVCSYCGSKHIIAKEKPYRTSVNEYQTFQCEECGGYTRKAKNSLQAVAR